MFINSENYVETVKSVLESEGEALAAVAFWGHDSELLLRNRGGKTKVICNLISGATNPKTIELLLEMENVEIRQHDKLHAKILVVGKSAIVGSANFSSNGLNLEAGEVKGWEEAGLLTDDSTQVSEIRAWFDSRWKESRLINEVDIEQARLKWEQRRATRIRRTSSASHGFVLGNFSRDDILDSQIFVTICGNSISKEAKKAYREDKRNLTGQPVPISTRLPPI
jgi:hypothetical protein